MINWWHVEAPAQRETKTHHQVSSLFHALMLIWKHWHDKCLWSVCEHYGFYDQRELFDARFETGKGASENLSLAMENYGYFRHLHQWQQAAIKKGYEGKYSHFFRRLVGPHKPCNMQILRETLSPRLVPTRISITLQWFNGIPFASPGGIEWFSTRKFVLCGMNLLERTCIHQQPTQFGISCLIESKHEALIIDYGALWKYFFFEWKIITKSSIWELSSTKRQRSSIKIEFQTFSDEKCEICLLWFSKIQEILYEVNSGEKNKQKLQML